MTMYVIAIILAVIGVALLAYVKANDSAENYGILLPLFIGVLCLVAAAVIAIIRAVFG